MKMITINKSEWAGGLEKAARAFRLFGPVKEKEFHSFKRLQNGVQPDFACLNTRLSPKHLIYPQSEVMFDYSLDESQADHHILKETARDDSPRAVVGIRPCDAKAFVLVRMNFDTPEYQDPYWVRAYEATTLVGLACDAPCSSCFCTTAGCGPYHEEGLDVLLADAGDHYLAKVLTEKGAKFVAAGGWKTAAEPQRRGSENCGPETGIRVQNRLVRADRQPEGPRNHRPAQRLLLGGRLVLLHQLRHLHLRLPDLLVLRHPGRNPRQGRGADEELGQLHVPALHPARHRPQPPGHQAAPGAAALHAQAQILRGQIRPRYPVRGLRPLRAPVPGQHRYPPGVQHDEQLRPHSGEACASAG